MRIGRSTIECWIYVTEQSDPTYFDYQHHHWDITPSRQIDTIRRQFDYTWTFNGNGQNDHGIWSTSSYRTASQATVVTDKHKVTFQQMYGYGRNYALTNGNTYTRHTVPEALWPWFTWPLTLATPSSITEMNKYIIYLQKHDLAFAATGKGADDWTYMGEWFNAPSPQALAWWSWTINLLP
jgi:hypothetical protein